MKTVYPSVSIILPCYNAMLSLEQCLRSLAKTKYPNFEIIALDDRSSDGSYETLQKFFKSHPKLKSKLFQNQQNSGPSKTRNQAVSFSKKKYIAFVETDMEFEPTWLQELVNYIHAHSDVAAVCGKSCDLKNKKILAGLGVEFDPATFNVVPVGHLSNRNDFNLIREVGLGAVGTVFRRDLFLKVGGFDEKFGHNIDDIDLSWRLWVMGYRQMSVPKSISYHWISKKLSQRSTPQIASEIITHKVFRVFIKNYELKSILWFAPQLIAYQLVRVVKNLFSGNLKPMIGFIGGWYWNICNLKDSIYNRKLIQNYRRLSDSQIINKIGYKGSYLKFVLNTT